MQSSLLVDLQSLFVTLALITPRTLVCLTILPGLSIRSMGSMRAAIAIAIALPAALPTFLYVQETPPGYILSAILAGKEAAIGLLIGTIVSIPVWVAGSIGSIADRQRIPIMIQSLSSTDKDASALGGVMLQALILVMIQAGLYVALTRILIESFAAWPAFDLLPPFELAHLDVLLMRFGEFFWYVVVYGAPIIIPLLLIDLAFALLGVFSPQLQVMHVSSPVKSLAGLFLLLVYWSTFSHYVAGDFSHMLDFTAGLLQAGR
jgi:type III secretion protein T